MEYKTIQAYTFDVEKWQNANEQGREEIEKEIRKNAEVIGGFFIGNHGTKDVIKRAQEELTSFFTHESEEERKKCLAPNEYSGFRGYWALEEEDFSSHDFKGNNSKIPCSVACIRFGPEDGSTGYGGYPNYWPDPKVFPNFRPAVEKYLEAMQQLHQAMCTIFERALDIACLSEMSNGAPFVLRVNHYPAVEPRIDQLRLPPHTDSTLFTLLWATECSHPSLQLYLKNETGEEEYFNLDMSSEDFLWCQLGTFLERLTNGKWLAAYHRVVAPKNPIERTSLTFLKTLPTGTVISPLPAFVPEGEPQKFDSLTSDQLTYTQVASSTRD